MTLEHAVPSIDPRGGGEETSASRRAALQILATLGSPEYVGDVSARRKINLECLAAASSRTKSGGSRARSTPMRDQHLLAKLLAAARRDNFRRHSCQIAIVTAIFRIEYQRNKPRPRLSNLHAKLLCQIVSKRRSRRSWGSTSRRWRPQVTKNEIHRCPFGQRNLRNG